MGKRKIIFLLSMAFLLFFAVFFYVQADDDGEDYEDKAVVTAVTIPSSTTTSKQKTRAVTETIIVSPAKTVTENKVQTISLPDRDRDGIADSEDAHPDIAEIYIVKDDNLNGIVDTFEYEN